MNLELHPSGELRLCTLSLVLLALLQSGSALAEGAVRVLDCDIEQQCDGEGICAASAGAVEFRMEPEALEPDGSGTYTIGYGSVLAAMQASSEAGPFLWVRDAERHTLLANSETHFLWHVLDLAEAPTADIRFLRCAFRQ